MFFIQRKCFQIQPENKHSIIVNSYIYIKRYFCCITFFCSCKGSIFTFNKSFCCHKNFSFNGFLMTKSSLSFAFTKVRVLVLACKMNSWTGAVKNGVVALCDES